MNCNFTEKVSSLIDGELTQAETREVERHLVSCGECQQMRADFLNLRSQIANFETSLQPTVQNRALKKILSAERRTPALGLQWSFGKAVAFASLADHWRNPGPAALSKFQFTGPEPELQRCSSDSVSSANCLG